MRNLSKKILLLSAFVSCYSFAPVNKHVVPAVVVLGTSSVLTGYLYNQNSKKGLNFSRLFGGVVTAGMMIGAHHLDGVHPFAPVLAYIASAEIGCGLASLRGWIDLFWERKSKKSDDGVPTIIRASALSVCATGIGSGVLAAGEFAKDPDKYIGIIKDGFRVLKDFSRDADFGIIKGHLLSLMGKLKE